MIGCLGTFIVRALLRKNKCGLLLSLFFECRAFIVTFTCQIVRLQIQIVNQLWQCQKIAGSLYCEPFGPADFGSVWFV